MPDTLATLPLSAIRVFEAAARLKSFTRAADELGMTQAAVSWQVKALERRLGQPLFRRLPREVAPTAAGERLARAATEAIGLLRTALADLTEADEGILSITTLQSLATQWLAPRLGAFQLAHPKIAVRLETAGRIVDLTREPFDLAIRSGDGDWPGLEAVYLYPANVTPLCAPALCEALGGLSHPGDLLSAPRVGLESDWAAWFAAAGVAAPGETAGTRLVADLQTIEVASALSGQAVALGSPVLYAAEIAQGRLVRPFEAAWDHGGGYWLAYPKERRRAAKIVAFREWLLGCIAADPVSEAYAATSPRASTRP
ncbi:LysR substrate-binding domain-containing protein [Phenylobacterium montanum]|uniref:LysR family transcriptional regulator n=1 Tax=Phenylobacterium montanum TaxID=2823693 RepID=A0A975IU57_9CAUL|nr:LysR substrate-binding domain-containing protein [Caulobacter sp. S6]QUD87453.1 LysR family transcriptional regulator [Caulobacter sp. S6]